MKTLQMIHYFNFVIATVFVVFYFYQIGYLLLGLLMNTGKIKPVPISFTVTLLLFLQEMKQMSSVV